MEQKQQNYRRLVRNLRLISESICPVCKEKQSNPEKAKVHCLKIFKLIKGEEVRHGIPPQA